MAVSAKMSAAAAGPAAVEVSSSVRTPTVRRSTAVRAVAPMRWHRKTRGADKGAPYGHEHNFQSGGLRHLIPPSRKEGYQVGASTFTAARFET